MNQTEPSSCSTDTPAGSLWLSAKEILKDFTVADMSPAPVAVGGGMDDIFAERKTLLSVAGINNNK